MDGREAISSFYLRRGFGSPPGMHPPPSFLPLSNPNPNPNPNLNPNQSPRPAVRSPGFGSLGSAFHVEPSSSHGGGLVGEGIEGGEAKEPVIKRKRGRPRKYGPDGAMALALSPTNSTPGSEPGPESDASQKRGRGRPPGSGRKQQLASLGEWYSGSAGTGFTPHVITIPIGEDIAAKIMSFSQQGPRAVCILSANGSVSTVTLRQPATSGGTVTYEGRFEILCLSGSYLLSDEGGSRTRSGGLSISLSSPDGRVIGGGVGGLLLAASPVQVIVGSFMYGGAKSKSKPKTGPESGAEPEASALDKQGTPSSTSPGQNLSTSVTGRWPVSRQAEIQNQSSGIDLTQG